MRRETKALLSALAACVVALGCVITLLNAQSLSQTALISEYYGKDSLTKDMFSGRCRCVGYNDPNPENHVVCACSGKDDVWNKGPWSIVTGYPVAVEAGPNGAKYLTIQGLAYPDGPKKPPHYYTLVQPWDDFGDPTMTDLFPDAHLGVPDDGFISFETTKIKKYPAFKSSIHPPLGLYSLDRPVDVIRAVPELASLFK